MSVLGGITAGSETSYKFWSVPLAEGLTRYNYELLTVSLLFVTA